MADRYSFSLTTFSPSGKLVQIEYALKAVAQGVTTIGIKATDGVVLVTGKKIKTELLDKHSTSKINSITPNIGMVYSGMGSDYRVLVDRARKISHTKYKRIYNEYPPTRILVQDIARVMQEATQSSGVRPYGVSLLVAGWDECDELTVEENEEPTAEMDDTDEKPKTQVQDPIKGGPRLYQVDASGAYFPWKATAIGQKSAKAIEFLEKRTDSEMSSEYAINIALQALKDSIDGELHGDTIEVAVIGNPYEPALTMHQVENAQAPRYRKLTPDEVNDYISAL